MELEQLRDYFKSKPGSYEDFPFDEKTLVLKVIGKMYALVAFDEEPLRINLKCDPDHAMALRAMYASVKPGYHMNKEHWNTIILDQSIPESEILTMIDESYDLVVKSLKKADRLKLKSLT